MYQHGKRTRQPRNIKVFFATVATAGVILMVSFYIVHQDIANTTAPKTNVPIVTEIGSENEEKLKINEELFSFELPADWKLLEHKNDNKNINAYIWASTKKGADDRKLTLHIDIMPRNHKLVRMQPLIPSGSKFALGNLSDVCVNFADRQTSESNADGGQDNAPFEAKWEKVSFMCDPVVNNQTIGTGTPEATIGTTLAGSKGSHEFYFLYEDHNFHPDNTILKHALTTFQAK